MIDDLVLTPGECVALINQTLEMAYPSVLVEGEVASFKYSRDKYVFFDLKDDEATLGCFMMAWQLKAPLEDGMRIKVLAEPRLTRWGKFSLTIRQVMPVGEGSIKRAFELLKAKLEAEGLLDVARKRALPEFPRTIGLIASVESAGYADFIKIINARWSGVTIKAANVQVQGMAGVGENIAAIEYFNQQAEPVDVLVVIRGGGSADDLAVYNDEGLARAIAASRIPTLVGVGHEVDTSLADLVADARAATPSNAAQIVVPDKREVMARLQANQTSLHHRLQRHLEGRKHRITVIAHRLATLLDVRESRQQVAHLRHQLGHHQRHILAEYTQKAGGLRRTLRQIDPQIVLRRGYALVRSGGNVVVTGQNLQKGAMITIELKDTLVNSEVKDVRKK